jgi:osmotically inducible protein OsmC
MATFARHATVNWTGSIMEGTGEAKAGTGAFTLPVSFPRRIGEPEGTTSPEELIAAAHSTCFSMALAHGLATDGNPPTSLDTRADVTFQPGEGITGIKLTVAGVVPGITAEQFQAAAEDAMKNCPVSQAISGTTITLEATHAT